MTPAEFASLTESIRADGQLEEIVLLEGQILDGRHRYAACVNVGVAPVTRDFDPDVDGISPAAYVLKKNLWRRHLSTSQRAAVAEEIRPFFEQEAEARKKAAQFKKEAERAAAAAERAAAAEKPADAPPDAKPGDTMQQAADAMGVSRASVGDAAKLRKDAPEEFQKVKSGEKTLNQAKKDAAKPGIIEAEFQRKAAADQLTAEHGEEFTKAVLRGDLLRKGKDFEDFMTLDPETQTKIKDLITARWTTKDAVAFMGGELADKDPISHLFFKLNMSGKKKVTLQVNGYTITVAKTPPPAPAGEPAPAGDHPLADPPEPKDGAFAE